MPNHSSPKKALRQTVKKTLINKSRVSRHRTFIKKLEQSIISNKPMEEIMNNFKNMQIALMKSVSKKALNLNNASRKISRMSKKIVSIKNAAN